MGYVLLTALVGGLGGLAAWAVMEPFAPAAFHDSAWVAWQTYFSLLFGGFIGGALGGLLGYTQGSRIHVLRGLGLGLVLGALGGSIGMRLGGGVAYGIFGDVLSQPQTSALAMPVKVLARSVVFVLFGGILGAVVGAASRSGRQVVLGIIGGALGGAAGGATFDIIGFATQDLSHALRGGDETGIVGRALTSLIIGAGIGLFTSLVRQVAKSAWVRQRLGRNEGKEWIVDKAQTFIGRNEGADIPLFGDNSVAPNHACIVRQGNAYHLMDGGSPTGTLLNGQRIQSVPLFHGAVIQVGSHVLEFQMRVGSAPQRAAEQLRAQSPMPQATPQPYAGAATMAMPSPTVAMPAQAPAALSLVGLSGPVTGHRFVVNGPFEIGREASGIALGFDTMASRRHASINPVPGGLSITDMGSTNGTFVNDARVQTAVVKPGDTVRFGGTTFRVEA